MAEVLAKNGWSKVQVLWIKREQWGVIWSKQIIDIIEGVLFSH